MTIALKSPARQAAAAIISVSLALGVAASPAEARNNDILKGAVLGLASGLVIYKIRENQQKRQAQIRQSQATYYAPQKADTSYRASTKTPDAAQYDSYSAPKPAASTSPLSKAFRSQGETLRVAIQAALTRDGYYDKSIDGLWGPGTENAVYAYALENDRLYLTTTEQQSNELFAEILK
ncbi:MAG: peptidoglycan-binding protein [Paracoccaceae bacterium]